MEVKLGVALNHSLNTCIETALAELPTLLLFDYFKLSSAHSIYVVYPKESISNKLNNVSDFCLVLLQNDLA